MRRILALAAFAATAFGAAGPAAAQTMQNPITDAASPWAFYGFRAKPPAGDNWFSTMRDPGRAVFVKRLNSVTHSFAATVSTVALPQKPATQAAFLDQIYNIRFKGSDPTRMKVTHHEEKLETWKGTWCTRYHVVSQDRGAPGGGTLTLRVWGLTCVHPQNRELAVDFNYSERSHPDESNPKLLAEGERFLSGVEFTGGPWQPELTRARAALERNQPNEAAELLKPLAAKGDSIASLMLGNLYAKGSGVPQDYNEAFRWYQAAAQAGEVDAQYNLGAMYDKALGVRREPAEAVRWFSRAADQRDPQAQLNLGIFYGKGDGVQQNRQNARRWFELAADNGNERARKLLSELTFD